MHDYPSRIYEMIKDLCKYNTELSIDVHALRKRVELRGYSSVELEETIENYIKLNLIMRDGNNIVLIDNV